MKRVRAFEITGTLFIIIAGSLFHFVYEWLNYWKPAALVFAVNESTWEHLKLAFWPAFFFAAIEYAFAGLHVRNFIAAKVASLYVMPAAIVFLFYTYTAILGGNLLFLDISIFIVAVIMGQIAGYGIMMARGHHKKTEIVAMAFLVIILASFVLFTFFPPLLFLFKDPVTGGYGIVR